jgi:hypothetical protein
MNLVGAGHRWWNDRLPCSARVSEHGRMSTERSLHVVGLLAVEDASEGGEVNLGVALVVVELGPGARHLLGRDMLERSPGRHRQDLVAAGALWTRANIPLSVHHTGRDIPRRPDRID